MFMQMKEYETNKYINIIKLIISMFLFFFTTSLIFYITSLIINFFRISISSSFIGTFEYLLRFFSQTTLMICLILLYRKDFSNDFKKFTKNFWEIGDKVISYWTIGLIIMGLSNILIGIFTPVKQAANEEGVQVIIKTIPFLSFILIGIIGPICEELVFRKAFKEVFKNRIVFILTSGLVFGSMHVIFHISSLYDYLYLIPYCSLGMAFAAICYDTDNIWSSIFAHVMHNSILTIVSIISSSLGLGMIVL